MRKVKRKVISTNYGRWIKRVRVFRDINQEDMARLLDCGRVNISLMESGKKRHSTNFILNVIRSLNITENEFEELTCALCNDYEVMVDGGVFDAFVKVCYEIDNNPTETHRELYLNNDILIKYNNGSIQQTHRISYLVDKFLQVVDMSDGDFEIIVKAFEKVIDK